MDKIEFKEGYIFIGAYLYLDLRFVESEVFNDNLVRILFNGKKVYSRVYTDFIDIKGDKYGSALQLVEEIYKNKEFQIKNIQPDYDITDSIDYRYIRNKPIRNFDYTHFKSFSINGILVSGKSSINLFNYINNTDKVNFYPNNADINVISEGNNRYIKFNWQNTIEKITIRVNAEIKKSNFDFVTLKLKRKSDDSVVAVHPLHINIANIPDNVVTTEFSTYITGSLDEYITSGLYLELENFSNKKIILTNGIDVFIIREYRKPLK